jgi:hypothetical protein
MMRDVESYLRIGRNASILLREANYSLRMEFDVPKLL